MAHKSLTSKEDFDAALAVKDKYVFIYAYEGQISPQAEVYAMKFAKTTDAYKVDVAELPEAAKYHGINTTPTALVYKDGKEIAKVEGMDPQKMKEIGELLS